MAGSEGLAHTNKKVFIPLENNPVVFSNLSAALGVEHSLDFYDVYSIDDPDLLALIPRPAFAVLFTCPSAVFARARKRENETMNEYNGAGLGEPVVWFRQTIGGACGLIALLHALANGGGKQYIKPDTTIDHLLTEAIPLPPTERAELLYESKELEAAHSSVAALGDTAPIDEDHCGNHYICFVKAGDGHLWELNGGMKGPLDRGALAEHEDALSERALELGVRSFMKHADTRDLDFSMVAVAPA